MFQVRNPWNSLVLFAFVPCGETNMRPEMRRAYVFAVAVAAAGSALFSLPAGAERICNRDCVGPVCNEKCVERDRDLTVGRGSRDREVIIEERRRHREPSVEFRERSRRPGVDIEVGR